MFVILSLIEQLRNCAINVYVIIFIFSCQTESSVWIRPLDSVLVFLKLFKFCNCPVSKPVKWWFFFLDVAVSHWMSLNPHRWKKQTKVNAQTGLLIAQNSKWILSDNYIFLSSSWRQISSAAKKEVLMQVFCITPKWLYQGKRICWPRWKLQKALL